MSLFRGLLAGVMAVAVAGVAVWYFRSRGEGRPDADNVKARHSRIATATPSIPTNKVEAGAKRKWHPSMQSNADRLALYNKIYKGKIPENLEPSVYFMKNPPTQTYTPQPRPEDIFQHRSERAIAAVLMMEPGGFVMQRTSYDESFDENFKKSLEEPTLLLKDDTPEQRELKKQVNEVKAELAERMRNGEKPSDIMTAAMNDAYELSKFRQDIEEMVREIDEDPDKTDQEVDDFVAAANKMLSDRGVGKIEMPTFVKRRTRLKVLARQKAAKADKTTQNVEKEK